jgi:23S rRNA G2445 N2-methylase RlmL
MTDVDLSNALTNPSMILMDPMCGSGTIAIEAALMMTDTAPGLLRYTSSKPEDNHRINTPVTRWTTDSNKKIINIWDDVYNQAVLRDQRSRSKEMIRKGVLNKKIYLNDLHPGAIELARRSSESANVKHMIEFCSADISELDLRHSLNKPVLPNLIITNPPWDRRLGDSGAASA